MQNKSYNVIAIQYGFIVGLAYTVALFLLYFMGIEAFLGFGRVGVYALVWAAIIYFTVQLRKTNDNTFTFGEALLVLMVMYVSAEVVWHFGNYVIYNFIDTDLAQIEKDVSIEKTRIAMDKFGMSESDIDKAMERVEKEDYAFTIFKFGKSLGIYMVIGLAMASIAALVIKKAPQTTPFDSNKNN